MSWQKGPLPPDTYGWGGVIPIKHPEVNKKVGHPGGSGGFYFADFKGDHVTVLAGSGEERLESYEVAAFDNSLTLVPEELRG